MNEKTDSYIAYLTENGYRPDLNPKGYIAFKKEGRTYIWYTDETDPHYFRLVYPNFWSIESDEERTRAYIACNEVCLVSKVARTYVVHENVSASVDLYFGKVDDFHLVFERIIYGVVAAVECFAEKMRKTNPASVGLTLLDASS